MKEYACRRTLGVVVLLLSVPLVVIAQPAPAPHHLRAYAVDSGLHAGSIDGGAAPILVHSEVVRVAEAPWLRLHFADANLGRASYLVLTAQEDGARQRLDAARMAQWQNASAFFNGDAVTIELFAGSGDTGVFYSLREVMVGESADRANAGKDAPEKLRPESICGPDDDRVASTDPASGRIVPIGCTGWIISNGSFLTAGHCVGGGTQTLEFNVPPSDPNGTINHPGPEDQYPIEPVGGIEFSNGGVGDDWGVFDAGVNDNGETAVERQQAYYRMSRDTNPATIRITGYGVDGPPPNFGNGPRNEDNQTQQTHSGASTGETVNSPSNAFWNYTADTQGGNSGSPVIVDGTTLTVGIHTHGGCSVGGGANAGSSFEIDDLEAAIQVNPGPGIIYADIGHTVVIEDGTVMRPFDTVLEAVNVAAPGGHVSIVEGNYDGETMVIDKALTISIPVGMVVIGN